MKKGRKTKIRRLWDDFMDHAEVWVVLGIIAFHIIYLTIEIIVEGRIFWDLFKFYFLLSSPIAVIILYIKIRNWYKKIFCSRSEECEADNTKAKQCNSKTGIDDEYKDEIPF